MERTETRQRVLRPFVGNFGRIWISPQVRGEIKNTFGRFRLASSIRDHFSLSLHFNIPLREGRSEDKAVQRERMRGRSEGKNNTCMVEYILCIQYFPVRCGGEASPNSHTDIDGPCCGWAVASRWISGCFEQVVAITAHQCSYCLYKITVCIKFTMI